MRGNEHFHGLIETGIELQKTLLGALRFNLIRPYEITAHLVPNGELGVMAQILKSDIHTFFLNDYSSARST